MEHLAQQDPQAPNVGFERVGSLVENLGGHVLVGPADRVSPSGLGVQPARPAEVADLDPVVFSQKKIFRLDVPVNDPPLVEVGHGQGRLVEEAEGQRLGQPLLGMDIAEKAIARGQFQQEVHAAIVGARVVETDDVWMIERFVQVDFDLEVLSVLAAQSVGVDLVSKRSSRRKAGRLRAADIERLLKMRPRRKAGSRKFAASKRRATLSIKTFKFKILRSKFKLSSLQDSLTLPQLPFT